MTGIEVVLGLLVVVAVLAGLARLLHVPYPVVLVLGGLAAGAIPGVPHPTLSPDLVFLVFLPPLVYSAAFLASTHELRADAGLISVLAVGLVLATMAAVAVGVHELVGVGWGAAFVLGAVLGPTDPVSATAIIRQLGAPPRLAAILEGEALVNDGTGLTAYKVALGAVAAGAISLPHAAGRFAVVALGGAAFGLAIGWLSARLRRALDAPDIELTVSLLTPFAAYVPADRFGLSGVLAAVTAGLYVGRQADALSSSDTRLRSQSFWEVLDFLLNSLLFLLIGLQFPAIVDRLPDVPAGALALDAALATGLVVAVRFAWMLAVVPALDRLTRRVDRQAQPVPARQGVVMAWSGMRGGVSLAAALAIPLAARGHPFPDRDLLLFLTITVVLGTLVLPGLTLSALIRGLGLGQGELRRRQDAEARVTLAHVALERIEELTRADGLSEDAAGRLRGVYEVRLAGLQPQLGEENAHERADRGSVKRARHAIIASQRETLADLHREGRLPADLWRSIERDLDLEEARL